MINFQTKILKQGQIPVGGDCHHTIYTTFKTEFQSLFMPIVGAMAIAPYGFFQYKKYINRTILSETKT